MTYKKNETSIVDARQAVAKALDYVALMTGTDKNKISVEEIDQSSTRSYWYITVGLFSRNDPYLLGTKSYKTITIDKTTGEVVSMKIRAAK